jgi:hypothetical protein
MPPPAWHARLRPRRFAELRRVVRFGEAAEHVDALTGEALELSSAVAVSNPRSKAAPRYYNAVTLLQCDVSGRITDPFLGLPLRPEDEEALRRVLVAAGRGRRIERALAVEHGETLPP